MVFLELHLNGKYTLAPGILKTGGGSYCHLVVDILSWDIHQRKIQRSLICSDIVSYTIHVFLDVPLKLLPRSVPFPFLFGC